MDKTTETQEHSLSLDEAYYHVRDLIEQALDNIVTESYATELLLGNKETVKRANNLPEVGYLNLAIAVFGANKNDPRRKEFKRVSTPWGLGSLNALVTHAIMKDGERFRLDSIDNLRSLVILGCIYIIACKAHDEESFDTWLEERVMDYHGDTLKGLPSGGGGELYRLLRRAQGSLERLNAEQLKTVQAVIDSMPYDPK